MGYGKNKSDVIAKQAEDRAGARVVNHVEPNAKTKVKIALLEKDIGEWLRYHGGEAFSSPWSPDHEKVLARIAIAMNKGGLFSLAMPRGHGKSTILKWVTAYVLLTGRRKYVVVIAATAEMAQAIVDFIRQQITESDTLHAHYPQVTTYARATDGKAIKARYQLRADGKASGILWSKTTLVFPEVVSSGGKSYASNGAILEAHGLTGAIRGKWKDTKTGKVLRPDFVILDDPQDRSSAESPSQCAMRERIITGDVLGLAGPRKRIAAVMPCTIIRKGDLADRFLDHKQHPEWQGEVCKLVNKWPDAQDTLWKDYERIYREETGEGRGFGAATEFYEANRAAMDAGAEVSWEHRVRDGEVSALQTAENLLIETGPQFWAEYQNEPLDVVNSDYKLEHDSVAVRVNGMDRRVLPENCTSIVGMADINHDGIRWALAAASNERNISIIDYGIYPGNGVPLYDKDRPLDAESVAVTRGLQGLNTILSGIVLMRGKDRAAIDLMLVDCGGRWMQAVFDWIDRVSGIPWSPSRGQASVKYRVNSNRVGKPGEMWNWARWSGKGKVLVHNSDFWRMRQQRGWILPIAAPDAIAFFGKQGQRHDQFADHVVAEQLANYAETDAGALYKWFMAPGSRNDWGDVATGLYVAASAVGASPVNYQTQSPKKARVVIRRPSR